ncbi:MAG: DUF721 domain-containing protein [Synergistaceae bacterium]|jgi:hypothetical protein|nr:DUF721 domain-containing protein [Synergistaceae bacterium]
MEREDKSVSEILSPANSTLMLCATLFAIEQEWASVVGDALSRRSCPSSYEDGILVVAVENRSAEQDLNFRKAAVLREIRSKASIRLKDIRTEIGRVKRGGTDCAVRARRKRKRPPVPEAEIDALTGDMLARDPKLRPEVARAAARCRLSFPRG